MSATNSPPGLVERVSAFVSENRRAVIIGAAAAVVAAGGVAYYASTSRRPSPDDDEEKGERRGKKKAKPKKGKSAKDADGPLLEERAPKVADVSEGRCACV
jgi:mitochondrial import receptor subunit TOM70